MFLGGDDLVCSRVLRLPCATGYPRYVLLAKVFASRPAGEGAYRALADRKHGRILRADRPAGPAWKSASIQLIRTSPGSAQEDGRRQSRGGPGARGRYRL